MRVYQQLMIDGVYRGKKRTPKNIINKYTKIVSSNLYNNAKYAQWIRNMMGVIISAPIIRSFETSLPNILNKEKVRVDIPAHSLGFSVISSTLDNIGIKSIWKNNIYGVYIIFI